LKTKENLFLETLKKKRDFQNKDEKPQLTKTEGRFETYTGEYYFLYFCINLNENIFKD